MDSAKKTFEEDALSIFTDEWIKKNPNAKDEFEAFIEEKKDSPINVIVEQWIQRNSIEEFDLFLKNIRDDKLKIANQTHKARTEDWRFLQETLEKLRILPHTIQNIVANGISPDRQNDGFLYSLVEKSANGSITYDSQKSAQVLSYMVESIVTKEWLEKCLHLFQAAAGSVVKPENITPEMYIKNPGIYSLNILAKYAQELSGLFLQIQNKPKFINFINEYLEGHGGTLPKANAIPEWEEFMQGLDNAIKSKVGSKLKNIEPVNLPKEALVPDLRFIQKVIITHLYNLFYRMDLGQNVMLSHKQHLEVAQKREEANRPSLNAWNNIEKNIGEFTDKKFYEVTPEYIRSAEPYSLILNLGKSSLVTNTKDSEPVATLILATIELSSPMPPMNKKEAKDIKAILTYFVSDAQDKREDHVYKLMSLNVYKSDEDLKKLASGDGEVYHSVVNSITFNKERIYNYLEPKKLSELEDYLKKKGVTLKGDMHIALQKTLWLMLGTLGKEKYIETEKDCINPSAYNRLGEVKDGQHPNLRSETMFYKVSLTMEHAAKVTFLKSRETGAKTLKLIIPIATFTQKNTQQNDQAIDKARFVTVMRSSSGYAITDILNLYNTLTPEHNTRLTQTLGSQFNTQNKQKIGERKEADKRKSRMLLWKIEERIGNLTKEIPILNDIDRHLNNLHIVFYKNIDIKDQEQVDAAIEKEEFDIVRIDNATEEVEATRQAIAQINPELARKIKERYDVLTFVWGNVLFPIGRLPYGEDCAASGLREHIEAIKKDPKNPDISISLDLQKTLGSAAIWAARASSGSKTKYITYLGYMIDEINVGLDILQKGFSEQRTVLWNPQSKDTKEMSFYPKSGNYSYQKGGENLINVFHDLPQFNATSFKEYAEAHQEDFSSVSFVPLTPVEYKSLLTAEQRQYGDEAVTFNAQGKIEDKNGVTKFLGAFSRPVDIWISYIMNYFDNSPKSMEGKKVAKIYLEAVKEGLKNMLENTKNGKDVARDNDLSFSNLINNDYFQSPDFYNSFLKKLGEMTGVDDKKSSQIVEMMKNVVTMSSSSSPSKK